MRAGRGLVALALLLPGCRFVVPVGAPVSGVPDEEPVVRVGILVDTTEAAVGAEAAHELAVAGGRVVARGRPGERWTFSADSQGLLEAVDRDGRRVGPFETPVRVRTEGDAPVVIAGRAYRGGARVRAAGPGRVTAINVLPLERYLLGVVPREIPTEQLEAVKAQAVAARTYAVGHLGNRERLGFDFYATVADQAYGGRGVEDPVATRALRETSGEILVHSGRPILAFYHSTCGGRTAAVDEVWDRAPLPYLRSVSDRVPGTEDRYYCETSNRFRWTERWTGESLAAILAETLTTPAGEPVGAVDAVTALETRGRTPSGRVDTLRIVADGRRYTVRGDSIRRVLRPEPDRILNSALFELDVERADGRIRRVTAHGGGWGHGIGMCQIGAIGRARAGQDYREILPAYYTDAELARIY